MPKIDLTNQIFGFWKVIGYDEEKSKKQKNACWICECQLCGTKSSVRGSALQSGRSTKCDSCNRHKITTDEVGNKYNNLLVQQFIGTKNNRKMWLCQCDCGNYIEVSTTDLRTGAVKSCGKCPNRESHGEQTIRKILDQANISYVREYVFPDLIYDTGYRPRFDFYIIENNYIIEYDGIQHFKSDPCLTSWNTTENVQKTQERDKIKNQYCFSHNIPIIRIPYTVPLRDITLKDLIPQTSKYLIESDE